MIEWIRKRGDFGHPNSVLYVVKLNWGRSYEGVNTAHANYGQLQVNLGQLKGWMNEGEENCVQPNCVMLLVNLHLGELDCKGKAWRFVQTKNQTLGRIKTIALLGESTLGLIQINCIVKNDLWMWYFSKLFI